MFNKNFNSTQLLLPNVKIPAQCYVHRTDLINENIETQAKSTNRANNRNTNSTSFSTIQQQTVTESGTTTLSNVNARQQTLLKRMNTIQFNPMKTFRLPRITTLPDPLGLMDAFLKVEWHDNLYSKCHLTFGYTSITLMNRLILYY